MWTLFMLSSWVIFPIVMLFAMMKKRDEIGKLSVPMIDGKPATTRDPMKLSWKKDWAKNQVGNTSNTGR